MRKALIVGVDHYEKLSQLSGCVGDALAVRSLLERHADGSVNFGCAFLSAPDPTTSVSRNQLRAAIVELFADDSDVALFYFAGHGHVDQTGGFLCASNTMNGDDGVSLAEVITLANRSRAKSKVILLDSCHAGIAGSEPLLSNVAEIAEGMTLMTATTETQTAYEAFGTGVFTRLLVDALRGAAANLIGDITPGSIYAHIDQSLGPWRQRPVFKTNVKSFISLRKIQPAIPLDELRRITEFFPAAGEAFQLDPTFAPERTEVDAAKGIPEPILENTTKFSILQKMNRVNLVVPIGVSHMWHAAMQSKVCRLTGAGEHYRRLVEDKLI